MVESIDFPIVVRAMRHQGLNGYLPGTGGRQSKTRFFVPVLRFVSSVNDRSDFERPNCPDRYRC
jgi:hypothetical protein